MSKRKITLQDLPAELNLMIIDNLDLESCLALSNTCKLFQQLVDLEKWMKKVGKDTYAKKNIEAMEGWGFGAGRIFGCAKCGKEITRYVFPEILTEKFPTSWVDKNLRSEKFPLTWEFNNPRFDRFDRLCINCAVTQENYCIGPWGVKDGTRNFWFHCDFHNDYVTSGAFCLRCHSCSDCWDIESIEPKDKRFARYHPKMPPCPRCWNMNPNLEGSNNNCFKEDSSDDLKSFTSEENKKLFGSVDVCNCELDFCKLPKHAHEVVEVETLKKTRHWEIPDFDPHPTRDSYVYYHPYLWDSQGFKNPYMT